MSFPSICQQLPGVEVGWGRKYFTVAKRFAAAILVIILSPILLAICIAILVLSGRPPLTAHKPVGRHRSELWVFKFRTMWRHRLRSRVGDTFSVGYIDDQDVPSRKLPDDSWVWRRFARCRRHSLDELDRRANVLAGQMSLDPRPVTSSEITLIYRSDTKNIGFSGVRQVSGGNRISISERPPRFGISAHAGAEDVFPRFVENLATTLHGRRRLVGLYAS
jgi:lipopolysaccharide/colanic/teichoic acid biosynthesis glycosyltransferase